jgi:hypothetical protein
MLSFTSTTPTHAGFGTAAVLSFTPRAHTPALGTHTASATPTPQARAAAVPPPSAAPSARTARAATPARPATAQAKDGDTAQDQDSEFLTATKRGAVGRVGKPVAQEVGGVSSSFIFSSCFVVELN